MQALDLSRYRAKILDLCARYPIRRLAVFGSALRGDFTPTSDIDLLVEFAPDSGVTFLDMVAMQDELAAILGREVDLVTPAALSPYFRQDVLDTAETIYERNR